MKKFFKGLLLLATMAIAGQSANAIGWPGGYEGVMLQGFYWDSYQTETKWTKLEARADELSKSFDLIWVPNSGKSTGGLGYIPIYWFTNHNSDMGSEAQLRSMIATYKAKGTGIIADFVVNHRGGKSNWTDFPEETWNGRTWKIGPEGICSTDEVAGQPGQAKPTGRPDEGEDFNGGRDLDHTNANVQDNVKNYAKCLLEDFGYAGFRLDMVKGYSGYYTKMYNQYAKPKFSVGEYWDGSYDALAAWIESTGGESAAFDFAFKYAVNEAFSSGDMTKLVWMENGTTPKPAGLIHHWYQQLAVTFIDNHDTYRDDWNKFKGNWAAANAFMICSPGTPCVFLPHWNACGDQIARMIAARKAAGISNTSDVRVLRTDHDCYMAELTGSKGKLVVKIGPAMASPEGYSDSQIFCSGEDYCIWTTTDGGDTLTPGDVTVYWDNSTAKWATPHIHYWGGAESKWPGVAMSQVEGNIWTYTCPEGTTGCLFNAGDGDATKTSDFKAIDGHIYTQAGDQGTYKGNNYPDQLYLVGHVNGTAWSTTATDAIAGNKTADGVFDWSSVEVNDCGDGNGYISFITRTGSDWNTEVNQGDRYGAASKDAVLSGGTAPIKKFTANVDASSAYSWCVPAAQYSINADIPNSMITISKIGTGVEYILGTPDKEAVFYNLQGIRIDNPVRGHFYIMRRGDTVTKVMF